MFSYTKSIYFSLVFLSLLFPIAQSACCCDIFKDLTLKRNLRNCKKLATLGAEFGWDYHQSPNKSILIDVLFGVRQRDDIKWIAWGVNPGNRPQMVGTRAIIGIVQDDGTLSVNKYNVTRYTKRGCQLQPSKIEFPVLNLTGEIVSNSTEYLTLSARLVLDPSDYDAERLNHVWQVGYDADQQGLEPRMHPPTLQNFDSAETINMNSGHGHSVGHHRRNLRVVHGILNIVGWGTILPAGVIFARYLRKFPVSLKWWYRLHIGCQITGYILGTAGWAIGLWLGRASKHYNFHKHRLLAIFIFTFTTLQMLALRLRPKPLDDFRKYWDMYHHVLGYALLAVIAVNIFHGIAILKPNHTWKWAYVAVLAVLGLVTLAMEIFTWTKFLMEITKNKKPTPDQRSPANQSATQAQVNPSNPSTGPPAKPPA